MARRRRRKRGYSQSTQGGKKVRVRSHSRSPRGPNRGKPRVKVPRHSRRRPRASR